MAAIGKNNTLEVVRMVDFGAYLDGEELGEILMPQKYLPQDCKPGDQVDVFVYLDSEDRLVATTEKPYAMVGEFASLKVVSVNTVGAFLDWGLLKDLLVPYREQKQKMEVDRYYLVYIYLDHESKRIVASAKIEKHVDNVLPDYEEGQEVDLIICNPTELGYKAIINNAHFGMLYNNEVFTTLRRGQHLKGYIKKIREDEKIDLTLHKPGYEKVEDFTETIVEKLKNSGGFIPVNDKTPSDTIYGLFGVSKKTFKKAIGALYKNRVITIEENGIRLC
ncbi:MAG: S1-like domain-containing RNA-binding protein [Bacteroidota bacterium]|nr:S1-like domain-containing RNA-binding protein [Bacteroidota bacterium]